MAEIINGGIRSGSPGMYLYVSYDYKRDGADMLYYIYYKCWIDSTGWYYNNVNVKLYLNSSCVVDRSNKSTSKGWSFEGNTGWVRVSNKTSGSTQFSASVLDTQNNSWTNWSSGDKWLTVAPAYTSITSYSVKALSETQLRVNWGASNACDAVQYSLDGGGWTGTSGTQFDIGGLGANTSHNVRIRVRRQDSGLWTENSNVSATTYDYPKPTSTNNFTIGGSPEVNLYNPLARNVTLEIISKNDNSVIGTYSGTHNGTVGAEFKTADAVDKQYKSIPNSKSGTYYAKATYGSVVKTYDVSSTYSIVGNENPTFGVSNITSLVDTLHASDITGDSSRFIQGHNKLSGTFTKMVGNKYAGGKKYIVSGSGSPSQQEITYADANKTFTIDNITSDSVSITAYDTRDLPTEAIKKVTIVPYSIPVVDNFTITRQNGISEYAILNIDGSMTHWSGWSGIKKYNTIQKVYVRYKPQSQTSYTMSWLDITSALSTNKEGRWTVSKVLDAKFTNTLKYDFEVYVVDLLEQSQSKGNVLSTANALIWRDLKNKRVGIGKKPEKTLDVNGEVNMTALYVNGVKMIWYE